MATVQAKSIRVSEFGDESQLKLEDHVLEQPKDNEVLIRVHAVGVNPVETYIRSGVYARRPALPFTPGGDCAGEVIAVGGGVSKFAPGSRVYTCGSLTGTYSTHTLSLEASVHPLPDNVSYPQGAAVGTPYFTAYRALFKKAGARAGESVLVHGASGAVGLAAVQLARAAGMKVIGTASSAEGRALVSSNGAHHVFDHSDEAHLDQIKDTCGPVDVVIEMLANVNLGKDLTILATGARVAIVGSRGTVEINPRDLMSREASVVGVMLFQSTPAEFTEMESALAAGMQNGSLKPFVGQQLDLAQAPQAHVEVIKHSSGSQGKIVLLPPQ